MLIYSDLHNEFALFSPPATDAEIIVLAGDIDVQSRGVEWANKAFNRPVIYCSGNHEFYKGHIDHTLRKMREAAAPHVHVLENQVWIYNQTRFLVSTAWTDFSSTGDVLAASSMCRRWMNDFKVIRAEERFRRLRPEDVIKRNHIAYDFLFSELAKPFDGKTAVITHHCPVPEVSGEKHDGHLCAAYTNCWHALVEKADLWIFGHTHRSVDVTVGRCRVVSNPRGYPYENTGFDSNLVISFPSV